MAGGLNKMIVAECDIPSESALDRRLIASSYFKDSYRASLSHPHASIVDIFLSIFAHYSIWMKILLIVRNGIVPIFGISAPSASEILHFEIKGSYHVGAKIGVWPILALTATELVVGRDNKHLDFRLSVLKETDGERASVVVSTICVVNNTFGKFYLFFVVPFHKWGVRRLISNAVTSGRL